MVQTGFYSDAVKYWPCSILSQSNDDKHLSHVTYSEGDIFHSFIKLFCDNRIPKAVSVAFY